VGVGAVREWAGSLADFVAVRSEVSVSQVGWSAGVSRADLVDRAVVVASGRGELVEGLRALAAGNPHPAVLAPTRVSGAAPRIAFVVPGHGASIAGALSGIYGVDPTVTATIDEIIALTGVPLSVLTEATDQSREALRDTTIAQPALYATAVALGVWWRVRGVEPEVVLGHSVGAYAAAALAGVFTISDGARIILERAKLVDTLSTSGGMRVAKCERATLEAVPQVQDGSVSIAVTNASQNHVLSGAVDALDGAAALLAAQGIDVVELPVTRAFHSRDMEVVAAKLTETVGAFTLSTPAVTMISDTTGAVTGTEITDPNYWGNHTLLPVNFAAALDTLIERNIDVVVELGPGGLLTHVQRAAGENPLLCQASVAKNEPALALARALGALWMRGADINWRHCVPQPRVPVTLPTYAFQRQRYWLDADPTALTATPAAAPAASAAVPSAGAKHAGTRVTRRRTAAAPAVSGLAREQMQEILKSQLAQLLGIRGEDIGADTGLFDLGLTSAMVVELRNQLESITGRTIANTAVFDHPTLERLAEHLASLSAESADDTYSLNAAEPVAVNTATDTGRVSIDPVAGGEELVDAYSHLAHEPIAIVGMGCRFPGGANDPAAYWKLLSEGRDGTCDVPSERWGLDDYLDIDPTASVNTHPIRGGFLNVAVDGFDADAFGIAPTEARSMDPQQRLLLEVATEALDDAGYSRDQLDGATGVFIGINTSDYMQRATASGVAIDPYLATGNTFSVAAGRLSYYLGVQGPAMAIDTACSSSLVALHLAIRSLRSGESDAAIVGGVNLMLSPATTVSLSKINALSPDGRSKPFSASANGYGRGEGCGVVLVKRLSDAIADGDRVWAVVRGSAINQDGRSAGLTVPHGPSQQAVIADALADAELSPDSVSYVEAHGTGTPLGDPIEMNSLAQVLCERGRGGAPLLVGSAKSNLGHLEAAAGIAGLIKVALMSHHRQIPATLHFDEPSAHIDWASGATSVPTTLTEWPQQRPVVAGLSSFGFSGTNAHVVIEQAPASAIAAGSAPDADTVTPRLLTLSARSAQALRSTASAYQSWLTDSAQAYRWSDITSTAAVHRPHYDARLAVVARSAREAAEELAALITTDSIGGDQRTGGASPRLIFAFSGQGSQWVGMGGSLMADDVARDTLLRCDDVVRRVAGWSLIEQITTGEKHSLLDRTEVAQPAIVAIQIALVELWRDRGVLPDAVVGHSIGELGAAYCSGALTLESAMEIAVRRGMVMRDSRGHGAMLVVGASPAVAADLSAPYTDTVTIAALNSPANTVFAGAKESIAQIRTQAKARGLLATQIQDEYAFHSYQMDPLREQLISEISGITATAPRIAYYSTVTGQRATSGVALGAQYWADNLASPVLFHEALVAACDTATSVTVVEVGPHAVLRSAITQSVTVDAAAVASMERGIPVTYSMLAGAGALYSRGHDLEHQRIQAPTAQRVDLPTYRWQRERHWLDFGAGMPQRRAEDRPDALADNTYQVQWRDADAVDVAAVDAAATAHGTWLVLSDGGTQGRRIVDGLRERGATVIEAAAYEPGTPIDGERIREHVSALVAECAPSAGVIQLVTPESAAGSFDAAVAISCASTLAIATTLAVSESPAKMWILTAGAVEAGDGAINAEQTPVWGLGRVISLEHPEIWGGMIDLDPADTDLSHTDPSDTAGSLSVALAEVLAQGTEDQVAYRDGQRLVARLERTALEAASPSQLEIVSDRAYLVTGGRGTLGLRIAAWLADRGAEELILLGRSPLPEDPEQGSHAAKVLSTVEQLRERGVRVHLADADVANFTDVEQLFAPSQPWQDIAGVVHAAGAFTPTPISMMNWETFAGDLAAKVTGVRNIEQASAAANLDFLVLYSSGSSVWGSALAGQYSAANYYLDMAAHRRSRAGHPTYALNWGWFADSAMGSDHDEYFESMGLFALPDMLAFDALDRLLGSDRAQLTVAPVDWSTFKPVLEAKRVRPLLADFAGSTSTQGGTEFTTEVAAATTAAARTRLITAALQREVAQVLGRDSQTRLDVDLGFFSAGMDSISSVALKRQLDLLLGASVPATAVFEHPTINALGAYLLADVLGYTDTETHDIVADDDADLDPLSTDELLELLNQELENK
ncbi:MAG: type I polyketide synthase, partial [Rhodococcus sp.]|nr:type I polyketide synthase [Rhodococcus sp. (in: high G+C Gram-positive bacteria)]